jgi:hypothetical protein
VPKGVLTDRGRQYTNWRGTTRFERELGKDRVKHIKSQAHHPMTLGKIERFWKTVYEEFLVRAQFGSFEEAQERVRHWVQYYNHRRPHQGIGGLYPADRYFEIQGELRYRYEARGYDFDKVQYRVAEVCKIDGKDVLLPGKQADRVRARSLLCYWAVRELGMSCTAIGRRLGMTQPAVSRAVQRGEKLAKGEKLEFYSGKVENVIFS